MNEDSMRGFGRAFGDALSARAPERLSGVLADDVEWVLFGPIDLFPFCGSHRGRAAVLDCCAQICKHFGAIETQSEHTMFDGTNGASLLRVSARHIDSGRLVSFRVAHFATFANGKLTCLKVLLDSLDAAEQTLGHPFDLSAA